MLSSIVRICVGGSVQRSFRSCSSANMHSLMLACMKYRFRINIGRTQCGPNGVVACTASRVAGHAAPACKRQPCKRAPREKNALSPAHEAHGLGSRSRERERMRACKRARTNLDYRDQRIHVHLAAGRREESEPRAQLVQTTWQQRHAPDAPESAEAATGCSPGSEAIGLQRLLEAPLVLLHDAAAPVLAPELADYERHHHEGGQQTHLGMSVTRKRRARTVWAGKESSRPCRYLGTIFAARSCS